MGQLPVFVINLDRRADRAAAMGAKLDRIGLAWSRVSALDAKTATDAEIGREVALSGALMPMGRGSQCCLISNFDIYRKLADLPDTPAGLILQDDAELASDIVALCQSADWIPRDIGLVQCERYGPRPIRRLVGPPEPTRPGARRDLRRLFSRSVGAAGYFITRQAAMQILRDKPLARMPIDHFLFNPNISPFFAKLGVAILDPLPIRQDPASLSDMAPERASRAKRKRLSDRARRVIYDLRPVPGQAAAMLRGARFHTLDFAADPRADR